MTRREGRRVVGDVALAVPLADLPARARRLDRCSPARTRVAGERRSVAASALWPDPLHLSVASLPCQKLPIARGQSSRSWRFPALRPDGRIPRRPPSVVATSSDNRRLYVAEHRLPQARSLAARPGRAQLAVALNTHHEVKWQMY